MLVVPGTLAQSFESIPMIDKLGYILKFTNIDGHQSHSIIVDCDLKAGLYGVRKDNLHSNVTLWIHTKAVQPGYAYELMPPDTPIRWRNSQLQQLIKSGKIEQMIWRNRQRLLAEENERRDHSMTDRGDTNRR